MRYCGVLCSSSPLLPISETPCPCLARGRRGARLEWQYILHIVSSIFPGIRNHLARLLFDLLHHFFAFAPSSNLKFSKHCKMRSQSSWTGMFAFAALFLLVPTAHAWPFCLNQEDANMLATNFGLLISSYSNSLANLTLAPDYTDYSESVNTLIDSAGTAPQSLLGATFSSRAQFETASAAQPSVPFQVENVWFTCDVITIRWLSNQSPQPVVGITVAHAVFNPNFRGHRTMYVENSRMEIGSVVLNKRLLNYIGGKSTRSGQNSTAPHGWSIWVSQSRRPHRAGRGKLDSQHRVKRLCRPRDLESSLFKRGSCNIVGLFFFLI